MVPAQDVDMNLLMQNYGMESDSDESADEDFSPTNVESNSRFCFINDCGFELLFILGSEDSQNESSSSSDEDDDEVTTNDKKPAAVPAASKSSE